jgi:transcriptional regulator with XRE-family HTH domain
MDAGEASAIGAHARLIRRRRGLSLDVVAGLAGISKPYLSQLGRGQRGFNRRRLLEDLADALGCSVADLTGQPYLVPDRATADALAVIAEITPLLYNVTLDHVPDVPARPVEQLASWAARANAHCDEARYALAGRDLGALLTELHVHAATGTPATRRTALAALVEACAVAFGITRQLGHPQLAVQAMDRGLAAAVRRGDPALAGFAGLARAGAAVWVLAVPPPLFSLRRERPSSRKPTPAEKMSAPRRRSA